MKYKIEFEKFYEMQASIREAFKNDSELIINNSEIRTISKDFEMDTTSLSTYLDIDLWDHKSIITKNGKKYEKNNGMFCIRIYTTTVTKWQDGNSTKLHQLDLIVDEPERFSDGLTKIGISKKGQQFLFNIIKENF